MNEQDIINQLPTLSVADYVRITNGHLDNLGPAKVKGEISGLSMRTHAYFTLKDQNAAVNCVLFRQNLRALGLELRDGMEITVTGRGNIYPKTGKLSLMVATVEVTGEGELLKRLYELSRRLQEEGVFAQHKRPLPVFVDTVGVITSGEGRVLFDIMNTVGQRNRLVKIRLYNAVVQGDGAAASLRAALARANAEGLCDVLIIGRGGGSVEELLAFSDEGLTRDVAASAIPIISAVGHEPDFALTDFAADARAATPTQAGVMVTAITLEEIYLRLDALRQKLIEQTFLALDRAKDGLSRSELRLRNAGPAHRCELTLQNLTRQTERMHALIAARAGDVNLRLAGLRGRLEAASPALAAGNALMRLGVFRERLKSAGEASLANARAALASVLADLDKRGQEAAAAGGERLNRLTGLLEAYNPRAVLKRGYSITRGADGAPVRVATLRGGERVTTEVADGSFTATVDAIAPASPAQARDEEDGGAL